MEIWKDIKNYEGLYKISNTGKIRSVERYVRSNTGERLVKGRIRKSKIDNGYEKIILSKNSKPTTVRVHRLVAQTFIPNPDNKPQVNHIDGNKLNNHVDNLEWVTGDENIKHAINIGLIEKDINAKKVKLWNKQETLYFDSAYQADKHLGCSIGSVNKVARGICKSIYGYQAKYIKRIR